MRVLKVAVIGTHGVGKSTVVAELVRVLGEVGFAVALGEVTRVCPLPVNEKMTVESQRWMFQEQVTREKHVMDILSLDGQAGDRSVLPGDRSVLVCDRSVLDPLVYAQWMAERTGVLDWQMFVDARIPVMLNWWGQYDLVYWRRPEMNMRARAERLTDDGFRSVDLSFQAEVDKLFERFIGRYKLGARPWVGVSAAVYDVLRCFEAKGRRGDDSRMCGEGGNAA